MRDRVQDGEHGWEIVEPWRRLEDGGLTLFSLPLARNWIGNELGSSGDWDHGPVSRVVVVLGSRPEDRLRVAYNARLLPILDT